MAVEIKRVSYTFNSLLEDQGLPAYFLDVIVSRDKNTLVDVHESFKSREEFMEAVQGIIPVLEEPEEPNEWDAYADHWQYYEG